MKLRHAAALALVGWSLVMPPLEACIGAMIGQSCAEIPLEMDSSPCLRFTREVREIQTSISEKGQGYLSQASRNTPGNRVTRNQAYYMTWLASQCIATDDPRLKGK